MSLAGCSTCTSGTRRPTRWTAARRHPALAFQVGAPVCLAATLTGALTAASVLWREPLDRLRARVVRDATVFTGLDSMTMPLLQQLARDLAARRSIVVIEPDSGHPLLDDARATGARVMIGAAGLGPDPAAGARGPSRLRAAAPVRAGPGRAGKMRPSSTAARSILRRYQPDPQRQPHLVARIDDPRHADHWRGGTSAPPSLWFEDALSAAEATARALVDRVFRHRSAAPAAVR